MEKLKEYYESLHYPKEGMTIEITDKTAEGRLAKKYFNKLLFEYFHQLSCGYVGWGVCFDSWLYMEKGWIRLNSGMDLEYMYEPHD